MPLVVPGINNASGNELQNWQTKLLGKTLANDHSETSFKESDLPSECRVIKPGWAITADVVPERLNVHVNEQGTIEEVTFG